MMNSWIEVRNKTAVIYDGVHYSYQTMLESDVLGKNSNITEEKIVACHSKNPFEQLKSMIYGLCNSMPVFFGDVEMLNVVRTELQNRILLEKTELQDVFLIATTSGTTGRKKALLKRTHHWLDSFSGHGEVFDIDENDVLFVNGSLAYTANLYSVLHALHSGGTVVLSKELNPRKWTEEVEIHNCTTAFLVPSKLRLLAKAVDEKWAHSIEITTAGEALDQKVLQQLYCNCKNMRIHHYYGAAEIGHISVITHEELLERPGSVGRVFPGVTNEIIDGVIYARSPFSVKGEYELMSAFDYGKIDEAGYLYVDGRRDTQYNIHGRKFNAQTVVDALKEKDEIEMCLIIDLRDVAVIKERHGESYGLYVISNTGKDIIEAYIEETFERWQWPRNIEVRSEALYSDSGKYDMVNIKKLFL